MERWNRPRDSRFHPYEVEAVSRLDWAGPGVGFAAHDVGGEFGPEALLELLLGLGEQVGREWERVATLRRRCRTNRLRSELGEQGKRI